MKVSDTSHCRYPKGGAEEELSQKEVTLIESAKLLELKNTLIAEMESRLPQAQSDAYDSVLRQLKILVCTSRHRLRQKLGLSEAEDLEGFVRSF